MTNMRLLVILFFLFLSACIASTTAPIGEVNTELPQDLFKYSWRVNENNSTLSLVREGKDIYIIENGPDIKNSKSRVIFTRISELNIINSIVSDIFRDARVLEKKKSKIDLYVSYVYEITENYMVLIPFNYEVMLGDIKNKKSSLRVSSFCEDKTVIDSDKEMLASVKKINFGCPVIEFDSENKDHINYFRDNINRLLDKDKKLILNKVQVSSVLTPQLK